MKSLPYILISPFGGLLLAACSVAPSKVPGSDSRVKVEQWTKLAEQGNVESKKPAAFSIPELSISNAGSSRKSEWRTGPEGRYQVDYWKFPKITGGQIHSVRILASPSPAPVLDDAPSVFAPWKDATTIEEKRKWEQVEVPGLKRNLRYYLQDYAFGDGNTAWKSEVFTVTAPDGSQGSYQVTVECDEAYYAKAQFAKLRLR